ncbi:hypothetical protein FHS20_000535 [Phyllobacterium endophyticum]|nr:rod-binding protein [Phyllobacterium endophyticum]MBB3233695.1 hypothetical protein [Phyllobacterium endophyticum]
MELESMAINPPSDLVLDVAMAADPNTLRASVEKLRSMVSDRVSAAGQLPRENFARVQQSVLPDAAGREVHEAPIPAFRKFEAFMLQSFVESMFTGDNQAVYGEGIAGNYWKSMMAEAVANKMADAGGIGVAKMLEHQRAIKSNEGGSTVQQPVQTRDSNAILDLIERPSIQKQFKSTDTVGNSRQG